MGKEIDIIETIRAGLDPHGIFLRGSLAFDSDDGPEMAVGGRARAVLLLGNVGSSIWPSFNQWRASAGQGVAHPLDVWSTALIRPVAAKVGGHAFFPSEKPWQPFQQWAMQAEGLRPSPLGILIHPDFGLWHGYRGAIAFSEQLDLLATPRCPHPCDDCRDKPCLSTCPAEAVSMAGFNVPVCRSHLRSPEGQEGCLQAGCLARNACPVGTAFRYGTEQLRFHMDALA